MPSLFDALPLRSLTLRNRIMMAPMCMYSAGEDALATDFHLMHYGARAIGGAALLMQEATAVEARGRITVNDLGLYNDEQIENLRRIVDLVHSFGALMGVQIAHAGRKAWSNRKGVGPEQAVAPSATAFGADWQTPRALAVPELEGIVEAFAAAARRALAAGYDTIELHAAHGYLIHEFISPLSNQRTDDYGGSLQNRMRLLERVVDAVRRELPADKPLLARLSCTDWLPGGVTIDDMVQVAAMLKEHGVDLVDCSSGGSSPAAVAPSKPGYQVPFAERVRREAGVATGAVGLIWAPEMADEIVCNERADLVILGRELLRNPHWPLLAAHQLGQSITWPKQYERAKR